MSAFRIPKPKTPIDRVDAREVASVPHSLDTNSLRDIQRRVSQGAAARGRSYLSGGASNSGLRIPNT